MLPRSRAPTSRSRPATSVNRGTAVSSPLLPSTNTTRVTNTTAPHQPHVTLTESAKRKQVPTPTPGSPSKRASRRLLTSRSTSSSQPVNTLQIRNDRLGTLVRELCTAYAEAPSWETFVRDFRGRSYLSPDLDEANHPAIPLLRRWRDSGVPAQTDSAPWSDDQKDECIRRGCHHSANQHAAFLREEMAEFIENKFWVVFPYHLV